MKIDYEHTLDPTDLRTRLEALGEYLFNRHGIAVTWNGDTAEFRGKYLLVKIEGDMSFGDGVVHFRGKDPGRLLRNKAVNYITEKLECYLDPNTPVDELPRG